MSFFLFVQEPTKVTSDITSDPNAGPQLVIWGTDVVVSQCKDKFRRFISRYVDKNVAADEQFDGMDINEPYYLQRLEEVKDATMSRKLKHQIFSIRL